MAFDTSPQFYVSISAELPKVHLKSDVAVGAIIDMESIKSMKLRVSAIRKLYELQNDWNGYGGIAPTDSSLEMAERFVRATACDKRSVDIIKPDAEGGVSLIWDDGASRTIFTFDGAELHVSRRLATGEIDLPSPVPYFSASPAKPRQEILALIPGK